MNVSDLNPGWMALLPAVFMGAALFGALRASDEDGRVWRRFIRLTALATLVATASALVIAFGGRGVPVIDGLLAVGPFTALMALLVQALGLVIGVFSSRYLEGERGQRAYIMALSGVLAAVHLLLLADHWLVLIPAWALVGTALQRLLCFYADRPFALLAAHKKRLADRLADLLLAGAALLCWHETGSGSLTGLSQHLAAHGASWPLQVAAVLLALAVVLRTALLPVHGWLIQVMEAPTPVSALLHAGVVNLGGVVLIRFAPLLDAAPVARWLLVIVGLATAVLAGMVMLTRVSIKVRLAWSTVAQMGFMVLECGLGLYMFAALHLVGHSLYKAHAFLSASGAVRDTRLRMMRGERAVSLSSLLAAPLLAAAVLLSIDALAGIHWPAWWGLVLAFAWAPMLWLPSLRQEPLSLALWQGTVGLLALAALAVAAGLAHALPLGLNDRPDHLAGLVSVCGMALLYLCLVILQTRPQALATWRRWSYAGFYLDEFYTRLALHLWPARWTPQDEAAASRGLSAERRFAAVRS